MNEKRLFQRIFYDANTVIKLANTAPYTCNLLDISLKGCLVDGPSNLNIADTVGLSIGLDTDFVIKADAQVIFINEKSHIGFHFTNIDLDSITYLRRLVELNIGNSTLLERNLQALSSSG
ncbi:MAG: hypothetical protein COB62_00490 [Piscirickettsiaceae bacterium]|nr:MAG: hypothetical protein COB62_00490 [Piscirickettsiaceae bacterium]